MRPNSTGCLLLIYVHKWCTVRPRSTWNYSRGTVKNRSAPMLRPVSAGLRIASITRQSHAGFEQIAAREIVMLDNLIFTAALRGGESAETAGRIEKVCVGSVDKSGMLTLKNSSGVCEKSHNPLTGPPPASYNLLQGKGLPVRLGLPQAAISWPRKRLTGAALSTPSTSTASIGSARYIGGMDG
jgi:hypothetical protein